jgi:hypothetical protein
MNLDSDIEERVGAKYVQKLCENLEKESHQ